MILGFLVTTYNLKKQLDMDVMIYYKEIHAMAYTGRSLIKSNQFSNFKLILHIHVLHKLKRLLGYLLLIQTTKCSRAKIGTQGLPF